LRSRTVDALGGVCGTLSAGTLTLVLSPPGHGKTSLLRALAGVTPAARLTGTVSYNGVPAAQLAAKGVRLALLASYVDQIDEHLPFLTVRETLAFAHALSTVDPASMGSPQLAAAAQRKVARVLAMLQLQGCADTMLGGVSGGERKRVSIAEALVSNARLLCLDEMSTGLDASTTFDILTCIRAWATATSGTVIASLQQPTPEAFGLFDSVCLLREGFTVYHGPRSELPSYWLSLGFTPRGDMADWLLDVLVSPTQVRLAEGLPADRARTTTASLVAAWAGHRIGARLRRQAVAQTEKARAGGGVTLESDFARRQYGMATPRPALATFGALVWRQAVLSRRNLTVLVTRVLMSVVSGLIMGTVWLNLTTSQPATKLGLFAFALAQMSFSNFAEINWVVEQKPVGLKQVRSGFYPAWSYTLASTALQLPIAACESALFSALLYVLAHLERDAGRFFFFYLTVLTVDVAVGSLFRALAYAAPTPEDAQSVPGPFMAIQLDFAGFFILPKAMGTGQWLVFLYYSSVIAAGVRSLAHNEFLAPSHQIFPPNLPPGQNVTAAVVAQLAALPGAVAITAQGTSQKSYYFPRSTCADAALLPFSCGANSYGIEVMQQMGIFTERAWKWGGWAFIVFFALLMNLLAALKVGSLARLGDAARPGSSYLPDELESACAAVPIDATVSAGNVLPFTPIILAWRNLEYSVHTAEGPKRLLRGLSGLAVPGRLISLMGVRFNRLCAPSYVLNSSSQASGAGKTTLLDVLACRATGSVTGGVFLNGFPREAKAFARLTAYCEQADVHLPYTTVREALHFSAALRLPASLSQEARAAFVQENLDLLELTSVEGRLVGEVGAADGLSQSQRKLLTIAVELCANASLLFCDEPTSGLDARASARLMGTVQRISRTGRTVITTIHQPSIEVFYQFDDILLLHKGGFAAYHGEIGPRGAALIKHLLQAVPRAHPLPDGMNPASWSARPLSSPQRRF